jgi:hypothetical protein
LVTHFDTFLKTLESKSNRHKRGGEVAHHHGPGDPCRKKAMNYGWTQHETTWASTALGRWSLYAWPYSITKSYRPKKERAKDQSLLQSQLSMTHFPLLLFFMTPATIYLICECTWVGMAGLCATAASWTLEWSTVWWRTVGSPYMHAFFENK